MNTSKFPLWIERLRQSGLVIGALLALLVLAGPLRGMTLQPHDVQAQTPFSFWLLEQQAVTTLLEVHQLPATDRDRITSWEMDAVRALAFSNLVALILKDPASRTPAEQAMVDRMAELVQERRIAAAQFSIDEYNRWNADPCSYGAPHGFTYEIDYSWCSGNPLVTAFRGPTPPTLQDFLNYGNAEIYQEFQEGAQRTRSRAKPHDCSA